MRRSEALAQLMPWAGIGLAGCAWFAAHQIGSTVEFDDCRIGSAPFHLVVNLVGLTVALLAALFARRVWRDEQASEGHRFLGLVGLLFALLLGFALLLQGAAGLIVPRCLA